MTKAKQSERDEAIVRLRETLKPGATVYTLVTHVARSGMQRSIRLILIQPDGPWDISWLAARVMNDRMDEKNGGIKIGGCGTDMGFSLVYNLSRVLFRDGFPCCGEGCPANDHNNAYSTSKQGQCIVCQKTLPGTPT